MIRKKIIYMILSMVLLGGWVLTIENNKIADILSIDEGIQIIIGTLIFILVLNVVQLFRGVLIDLNIRDIKKI